MKPRVTALEEIAVPVSERTTWLFVRLVTNVGVTGLGEASLGTTRQLPELGVFFDIVEHLEELSIATYRQHADGPARLSFRHATAASAIEHALWDIRGKLLDAPVYELLGGPARERVGVYANINRMTKNRVPDGFAASAEAARAAGFRAFKAAPFDGFPPPDAHADAIRAATDVGIGSLFAMREALGPDAAIKVDCHSFFDVEQAIDIARTLEPVDLDWYEEPLPVAKIVETRRINDAIAQRMAGGETLYGVDGFDPLVRARAVDVIMPDVIHCGGILEAIHIARNAATHDVAISPHNAVGPVATAVSAQVCFQAPNVESLELQWGECDFREELVVPPETFVDGELVRSDNAGLGIELNEDLLETLRD